MNHQSEALACLDRARDLLRILTQGNPASIAMNCSVLLDTAAAHIQAIPVGYTQDQMDTAVQLALEIAGTTPPKRKATTPDIDDYLAMLGKGATLDEIADKHGMTNSGVHVALARRGLPTCARKYAKWVASGAATTNKGE